MKERILGIDAGTNSLGWAVVDYDEEKSGDKYTLIDRGVNIYAEGVKTEKGIESSRAAERTDHKHLRVGYWRRKVRKINLLRILREAGLCPELNDAQLKKWRKDKAYPTTDEFMLWQRTDDLTGINPYYYRNLCLTAKLDMNVQQNRYIVGRAIYHINQRRGFLSNRKEETKQSDGAVIQGIGEIDKAMAESDCEYLGQYFFRLYQRGEKIRGKYTDRLKHYEKELLAICRMQGLGEELTEKLRKTIITQRPLKSQKHTVGHCMFEKGKTRCPASHPLFEQYRMYAFINNIKIQTPFDNDLRPLTVDERNAIIPLFLKRSKRDFDFIEIAKKLSGRKDNLCYYKDKDSEWKAYRFNYHMDTSVNTCTVTAALCDAFGVKAENEDAWIDAACEVYTKSAGKNRYEIMNDVWHALFFFDDDEHLKIFAKEKLQMDDEHAEKFAKIRLPQDYAQLSLCAIRKILPYMKQYGLIYSHAVFLANLTRVVPAEQKPDALCPMLPQADAEDIVEAFNEYDPKKTEIRTREEYVKLYVAHKYGLDTSQLQCLYHPSMIETFPHVTKDDAKKGCKQLGSPRTNSLRNPMAMHSLFRMRHVVNALLAKDIINEDTIVRIEFARELNDANRRAAIRDWQRQKEKEKQNAIDRIQEHKGKDYLPTEDEILKYQLWEEQGGLCLYTGDNIRIEQLLGSNNYDIEHTIPRSVGGDTTAENLTVCQSRFNREVKRDKIPSELANHEDILERIAEWKERYEDLDKRLRRLNTRGVADKSTKDNIIRKRHRLTLERDYWRGKYNRFTMTEVPEGFARRQGVDISVISRYGREYLKSVFRHVYIVKGVATAEFRRIWGLQDEYQKKARVNHCHHTIDAITIACIGKAEYDKLAQYYHDEERHIWSLDSKRATFPKPWTTFTEDLKQIEQSLVVSHYTRDNMPKHTRKRIHGTRDQYMQGDTARGSLHLDTYYGAIERDGEVRYVVRRNLDTLTEKDVETIVDDEVRSRVLQAIKVHGSLKKAVTEGVWMNEEKGVPIKKVRCYANSIKRPLHIRQHRDVSSKEHKRTFHVANESNYVMGIYVGLDAKGKEKREFELANYIDTATFYKRSNDLQDDGLLPEKSSKGYPLRWSLKPGILVLLYEKSSQEIYSCNAVELSRRLYKITGLSSMVVSGCNYGRITFVHHQEARPSTEIKQTNGAFKIDSPTCAGRMLYHTQFHALIQGQDFIIDETGKIIFKHR